MKYNININQKGLEFDNQITITEASVIDWLHTFAGTNNRKINENKVDGWTWINCQFLVDDMPLLRIKTRSGGLRLLNRVEELGYIELKREPRKLLFRCTEKMDSLYVASEHQDGASKHQSWCLQAPYHNTNNKTKSLVQDSPPLVDSTNTNIDMKTESKSPKERLIAKVYGMWIEMAKKELDVTDKDIDKSGLLRTISNTLRREEWEDSDFKALFKHFFNDDKMAFEKKLSYALCMSSAYISQYKLAKKVKKKSSGEYKL